VWRVIQVGDHVYWCRCTDGSYKELTLTDEMFTFPLHDSVSFQQGAAIGIPYFTAYRALVTKARLKAHETVLVHGASGAVRVITCASSLCMAVMHIFDDVCVRLETRNYNC